MRAAATHPSVGMASARHRSGKGGAERGAQPGGGDDVARKQQQQAAAAGPGGRGSRAAAAGGSRVLRALLCVALLAGAAAAVWAGQLLRQEVQQLAQGHHASAAQREQLARSLQGLAQQVTPERRGSLARGVPPGQHVP